MERVAIFLRKTQAVNRFRDIILSSFRSDGFDDLLLCSGFFQERGVFSASAEFSSHAPQWPCLKEITVVGVYSGVWRSDFDRFVANLSSITCPCGRPPIISKRRTRRYHWHAKVFVALSKKIPTLGIVGSSNITRRAFGNVGSWNYEADAVLWDDSDDAARGVMGGVLETLTEDTAHGAILANYAADDPRNRGLSITDRLRQLMGEIADNSEGVE